MKPFVTGNTLRYRTRFWYEGYVWQHCGWTTAVYHLCGLNLQTGEKRVISCHALVEPFQELFHEGLGI